MSGMIHTCFHILGVGNPHYETWAMNNQNILTYSGYSVDSNIFGEAVTNTDAPIPISALWDQDKYQQSQGPDWIPDSTQIIGLAEFTNANFFSKDTTLQLNNYPHPSISETNFIDIRLSDLEDIDAEDGQIDRRIYISKSTGEPIQHLAAISYLHMDLLDLNIYQNTGFRIFFLDDRCFEEYASHLVPMAVGYSAGLLNYFFRGKINIIQTGNDTFQIVNLSDEEMEGDLSSFKLFYDDINDDRYEIALNFIDSAGNPYTDPILIQAQSKSLFTVKLNLQSTPIVNPKIIGEYMLVFKGRIGSEGVAPYNTSYAVVAQIITPHFLTHVTVNGQSDIYEYDLRGNRIYNVTEQLPRGTQYHHGIPNPVNPDLVVFQSDMSCPENSAFSWTVCSRILTKSTGTLEVAEWVRIPWWSNDGQRVYASDGGYYDMVTGQFTGLSPWNQLEDLCYGIYQPPSLSFDESMLVIEGNSELGPNMVDVIIYAPGQPGNAALPTDIVDMNSLSLATTNSSTMCDTYWDDEPYFDTTPAFHPGADRIVFSSDANGAFNIYHTDFSTRTIQALTGATSPDTGYYQPSWSPDGQMILLVGEMQGNSAQIYIMSETGGTLTRITNEAEPHYYPQWMEYLGQ